jgi:hypothetical protein
MTTKKVAARSSPHGRRPKTGVRRPTTTPADAALLDYQPSDNSAAISFTTDRGAVEVRASRINLLSAYFRARSAFESDTALARALDVDRTRLSAWKKADAEPRREHLRTLADLATVSDALRRFLHPAVLRDWLETEQPELDGRTPIEALREGRLADVLQSANATEHGAYG